VCHTLECGLMWAHRAFDELILPAMTVSSLCITARLRFLPFFRCVWLTSSSFGADTSSVWSEESARSQQAPRGEGPDGDAAGGGSSDRCRGSGERGDGEDDP
jgi:hypothetical protein